MAALSHRLALACRRSDIEAVHQWGSSGFLIGPKREFCQEWPNQQGITVKGAYFFTKKMSSEVGDTIASFVAKVFAGQLS
jgi:hypothetical protein